MAKVRCSGRRFWRVYVVITSLVALVLVTALSLVVGVMYANRAQTGMPPRPHRVAEREHVASHVTLSPRGRYHVISGAERTDRVTKLEQGSHQNAFAGRQSSCSKSGHPAYFVFIKVHKAGSSTIYNLLARYAINHDLNVALPELDLNLQCSHTFGPIKEDHVIPLAPGQPYHTLFSHMTYNRSVLDRFLPEDAFYVSIMRDPFQRFLSGSYYYRTLKPPDLNNTENAALKAYFRYISRRKGLEGDCRLHNSILCDTGLPAAQQKNEAAVRQHLNKLDQELDLMLVMEHFAESVILLKRRACLQLKDVLYFKANTARDMRVHEVLAEDVATFRAWQSGDYMAYEHFYPKFWAEIGKEGDDFHREVSHLKDVNERVANYCSAINKGETLAVARSEWNEEFTVNSTDCRLMKIREVRMHKLLVERTWDRRSKGGYRETREIIPQWTPTC